MTYLGYAAVVGGASSVLCLLFAPVLVLLAKMVGLVDQPNERKRHLVATPLVGGLAIYLAVCCSKALFPFEGFSWSFLGWVGLVLIVGVVDDFRSLSPKVRIQAHALVVIGIFITDGLAVSSIGSISGGNNIVFSSVIGMMFVSIVGVVGAVNTVNMTDGVDGLLASLVLLSLLAVMLLVSYPDARFHNINHIAALLGACLSFLVVNSRFFGLKRASIFLGDAGSTVLGFFLVYLVIQYTQGANSSFSPVVAGWIVGLPLLDASAVMLVRVFAGRSPTEADRSHLHHFLLDRKFSVNHTVLTLAAIHASMIVVAIVVTSVIPYYADAILFWGFVLLVFVRVAVVYGLNRPKTQTAKKAFDLDSIIGGQIMQHRKVHQNKKDKTLAKNVNT